MLATIVLLTALFEAVTLCGRFVFGLQSTRDTRCLARWTGGLRIHHGYVGVVLCLVPEPACFCVGAALVLSDLAHHFLVLWPITGHHAFDLTYHR